MADAVDDLDVNGEQRSKAKYMKVLRKVANRQSAAVVIDLNDVKEVSLCIKWPSTTLTSSTPTTLLYWSTLRETLGDISSFSQRLSTRLCLNPIMRWTILPMSWMLLWIVGGHLTSSCKVGIMPTPTSFLQSS